MHKYSGIVPVQILVLFISEAILLWACYIGAAYIDTDIGVPSIFLLYESGLARIGLALLLIIAGMYFRDLYTQVRIPNRLLFFQELCLVFGIAFLGQGMISYLNRNWTIPRRVMMIGSVLAIAGIFAWRLIFHMLARTIEARRVLFLGMSPVVEELARHLDTHPEFGLTPAGYLETELSARPVDGGIPRLGSVQDFDEVMEAVHPNIVVIANREDIKPWWANEFLELRFAGVHAEQAATFHEKLFGRVCSAEIWPSKFIFGNTWRTRANDVNVQTLFSMAIGIICLAITLPLILPIAALIKITSRGPLFLRERRVGLHRIPFDMLRFRSIDERTGAYTPIGRLLVRSGLDKLPRLFNVIVGDLAIAGPQPDRPEFAQRLSEEIPFYWQRYEVKPGLASWPGMHSGNERNSLDVLRRLECDLYYVKRLSPVLDSFVVLDWLKSVFLHPQDEVPTKAPAEII